MSQPYRLTTPGSLGAAGWLIAAFMLLPLVVVFPVSLTDQPYLSMPKAALSLDHFQRLLRSADWLSSAGQSLGIAMLSATMAVIFGASCAIGCWRSRSKIVPFIQVAMILPLVVPPLVYALGYYRLLLKVDLLDTFSGVILAHFVTAIPYVFITVTASLAAFDRKLELAAKSMGASVFQTLFQVVIPNIRAGLASGAILAFIHSWDEVVVVLFIASRKVYTLPRRIWDGVSSDLDPMMASAAALLIVGSLVLFALNLLITSRNSISGSKGKAL